jgi:hypothetical protein
MQEFDLQSELDRLRQLAGVLQGSGQAVEGNDSPLTHGGTDRAEYARRHNIKSGTDEWFKLWFARQRLTGEDPIPRD